MGMVWRRRLAVTALIAAACSGHAYDVGVDGAAGEAGAAGESAEPATATGGSTSTSNPAPGTGASPVGAAGTTVHAGTGGSDTSQPVAGTGGTTQPGNSDRPGDSDLPGDTGGTSNDTPVTGAGGADDGSGGADDGVVTAGTGGTSVGPTAGTGGGTYTGNGRPADCALLSITTQADLSPTDQCTAVYVCAGKELEVSCDGENDGTNTSLCDCRSGDVRWHSPSLVQGEAPLSCSNGLVPCFNAWPAGG
jgi:hypothetical protein